MADSSNSTFLRAKNLLLQAVDTVLEAASSSSQQSGGQAPNVTEAFTTPIGSTSRQVLSPPTSTSSERAVAEHRRVFGYKPLKGKGP